MGTGSVAPTMISLPIRFPAAVPVRFLRRRRRKGDRHRGVDVCPNARPVCATEPVPLFPQTQLRSPQAVDRQTGPARLSATRTVPQLPRTAAAAKLDGPIGSVDTLPRA